jgi:hypothetical protein
MSCCSPWRTLVRRRISGNRTPFLLAQPLEIAETLMLKAQIDEDDFCKKLVHSSTDDPKTRFYALMHQLLLSPDPHVLEALLLGYSTLDVVNGLKHLIKFKFLQLREEVRRNLVKIVGLMLGYGKNIDTLVVNLLRMGMVDEVCELHRENPGYFQENQNALLFLAFSCSQVRKGPIQGPDFHARDFLFMRIHACINERRKATKVRRTRDNAVVAPNFHFPYVSEFTEKELKILFTPTPPNLLSSRLSADLELDLLFMAEAESNLNFYSRLLLTDYIRNEEEACAAMRFLANIPTPLCIDRVVGAVLGKYPTAFLALVFDLLFYNQSESINQNVVEYLMTVDAEKLRALKEGWEPLGLALSRARQEPSSAEITRSIHAMNFVRFYGVVREMRVRKRAFIPRILYGQIIRESVGWDGYAQVYLWKILAHQRILFGYEVGEVGGGSIEAMEGMEVIAHLRQ